jgi:hypothetical protein
MADSEPRLLTIKGKTMSAKEWSRVAGSVHYSTIIARLDLGWPHERAVFFPVDQRRSAGSRKAARRFGPRGSVPYAPRPAVNLAPAPHRPNPHPPTWGGYSSYPIEAIALLRRVA